MDGQFEAQSLIGFPHDLLGDADSRVFPGQRGKLISRRCSLVAVGISVVSTNSNTVRRCMNVTCQSFWLVSRLQHSSHP
jgi:hypothetical protein